MKHIVPCLLLGLLLILSCSFFAQKASFKKSEPSSAVRKELEEAERKMWANIMKLDSAYFKNYVSEDYITINADGVMANKEETLKMIVHGKKCLKPLKMLLSNLKIKE